MPRGEKHVKVVEQIEPDKMLLTELFLCLLK